MSPALLTFLLFLPFCIVLIAAGIPFCLKGYKKGLWRSLVSLGVTIVSAVLSLLLANLLAMLLDGPLYNALRNAFGFGEDMPSLLHTVLEGIVRILLASVWFFFFFLLLSLVGKALTGRIKSAPLDRKAEQPGMKWGGLGVRALDAILFALLLPLPIYGTVAAYIPAAEALVELAHEEVPQDGESFLPENYMTDALGSLGDLLEEAPLVEEYISATANHPLVRIYSVPPFSTAYAGISGISVDGDSLNLSRSVRSMTDFTKQCSDLLSAPKDQFEERLTQFSAYLQDDVIDSEWFYVAYTQGMQQLCDGLEENISQHAKPEDRAMLTEQLTQWRSLADIPKDRFSEINRILPLTMELSVRQENKDTDDYQDKLTELGKLLSASQEAQDLKQAVFSTFVNLNDETSAPSKQDMLDGYRPASYTDADMQRKDAEAFLQLLRNFGNTDAEQVADILKQVPGYEDSENVAPNSESSAS